VHETSPLPADSEEEGDPKANQSVSDVIVTSNNVIDIDHQVV